MPSKPSFWSKSNRSQASVGSTTDYASSASSEHRYRQPDDSQRSYHSPPPPAHQGSNLSLERPPINVAAAVHHQPELPATPIDRAAPQSYASYSPHPDKSVNNGHEKKSLRSRLGLGHSSKDGAEQQPRDKGLGRRVSVRKKEVPTQRPQSIVEDQQRYWQGKHLAPSHEAEETNTHLDPFLQVQPEPRSPAPPAKDTFYDHNSQPIGQSPEQNEYRRPSLARVNTEQSFQQSLRARNSGENHYSPHPHGNGGLSAHTQPPPHYQSYAQPPQMPPPAQNKRTSEVPKGREKYQKVKRYFFEQQSQVHSLQNTLAHQRLSQSRTSLDDTEYNARFERLHGLVKQAAFAIRKIWKEIPLWLQTAVNHDAVKIGQREMTAVGRAVITKWLLDEIFNKFFHPDLDQHLSKQLKSCHVNIRKNAPLATNTEEEEALTSKLINWRLATTEGFADQLRGPQALTNREHLIKSLNEALIATMEMYVIDPNHEDFKELKANVPPIIELAVNILSHLPMESREIAVEHYSPGHSIMGEMMSVESGIPALATPCAEGVLQHHDGDAAERASLTSTASDLKDPSAGAGGDVDSQQSSPQGVQQQQQQEPKRSGGRGMFSSIMGGGGKKLQQSETRQRELREQQLGTGRAGDNGGSQVSLQSGPPKEEIPPRVRIATGMSVRIYGKGVLWKATVFPTA
ncbi:hypothetical protein UCRNP2_10326 [Neofusicoccum parvum UCRNP2]|uniref:S-adenosylmethionine-dependent methyltransferase-like protein n=1 Tax=Botryosphaeria parva (strain UCR-NP2) TaxID=1287680 RepID=R1FV89_BOTPV|nr:hypothetical protein UCRNP2_10326 [Neofusicoccum parvum UCRNP2]